MVWFRNPRPPSENLWGQNILFKGRLNERREKTQRERRTEGTDNVPLVFLLHPVFVVGSLRVKESSFLMLILSKVVTQIFVVLRLRRQGGQEKGERSSSTGKEVVVATS